MALIWAAIAVLLAVDLPSTPGATLRPVSSGLLIAMLVVWQMVYWCSWSPSFWAVVSEVQALEVRAFGTGFANALLALSVRFGGWEGSSFGS